MTPDSACTLILRPVPLGAPLECLTTSRRDRPEAIGLPGGTVEHFDPTPIHTAQRETLEETGVLIWPGAMWPIYSGPSGDGKICITYWAEKFDMTGLGPRESGIHISWRPLLDLLQEPAPFWRYNRELFRALTGRSP